MHDEASARHLRRVTAADRAMTGVFRAAGGLVALFLLALAGYIIIKGFLGFSPEFLRFDSRGIGNQLFNTVYLVFLSLVISVPAGILAGIFMAEYAGTGRLAGLMRICIESLSSLPSIVVGLFGYLVFILMTGQKWNLMAGALAVSVLSLPSITATTEDALRSLPAGMGQGSMALGATRWKSIAKVELPACLPRIATGVILAAGRGFGEAAALLYTAGQSTNISWSVWDLTSARCPLNPFRPGETLALHIWVLRTEGSLIENSEAMADFSAALLVVLVLGFSLLARMLSGRLDKKLGGGK